MTLRAALAAIMIAATGVAACRARAPLPVRHEVEIRRFAFEPDTLRIHPGDTVVWINRDLFPHTATAGDSGWTTGPLTQGDSGLVVVGAPGESAYFCEFHPGMTGTVRSER